MRASLLTFGLLVGLASTTVGLAQESKDRAASGPEVGASPSKRVTMEERPFAYVTDPTTPSKGVFSAEYGFGLASGTDAARPLPASVVGGGAVHNVTLGYGATGEISPFVVGSFSQEPAKASGAVGLKARFFEGSGVRLGGVLTGFREFSGAFGTSARLLASWDPTPRLRLAGNLLFEKVFASKRDGIDVLAFVGASVRVFDALRLGVEYVGQDLEDAIEEEEAEGGAKHFVGPTISVDLIKGGAQLVLGPAFGLNAASPRLLGRATLLVSF